MHHESELEFRWDGHPLMFWAGDRAIPCSSIDDLTQDPEGEGWCATTPLGETGVELLLYAGDLAEEPWAMLYAPAAETRLNRSVRVGMIDELVVVERWKAPPGKDALLLWEMVRDVDHGVWRDLVEYLRSTGWTVAHS